MEKEKKAEKYEDKITEIDTAIGDLEELPETKPAEETK
jgi:hypothetical protein